MTRFLTFILFLVLGVYLFGAIGRWLLRRWILRRQREFAEQFGRQGGYRTYGAGADRKRDNVREGEIRVQKKTAAPKRVRIDVGEYVEYEEYESVETIETVDPESDSPDREPAKN